MVAVVGSEVVEFRNVGGVLEVQDTRLGKISEAVELGVDSQLRGPSDRSANVQGLLVDKVADLQGRAQRSD